MKKLMTSALWGFTVWIVTGFAVTPILIAQNINPNKISGISVKDAVIDFQVDMNVTDLQLAEQINTKIDNFVFYGVYDYVTAEVTDGIVTLKGWTHEQWIADVLAKKLSHVEGVKKIDNQIQQAFGSEDLARRAVIAIYSDALFEKYSFSSNPPIHVVVDNNKIILMGVVEDNVELNRAAYLVDFKTNALTITNQLAVNK